MGFYSLHNHTQYSNIRFLDSINRAGEMIDKAIRLGFGGIAFTEHEALSGGVSILKEKDRIKEEHPDFKIIFGNEIYLIDESEIKNTTDYYHFILLAKDIKGWEQLRKLSSRAWDRGYTERGIMRVPTTYQDIEEIIGQDRGHLIGSSACIGGRLGKNIINHDVSSANQFVKWCISTFGKDNFFLEMQPSDAEEQILVNQTILKFSEHYDIPYIVTTDSHYLDKDDLKFQSAFLNSKQSGDRETEKFYKYTYIMEEQEMVDILKLGIPEEEAKQAIKNTELVGNLIEDFDFRHSTIVPKVKLPEFELERTFYRKGYEYIDKYYDSPHEQDRFLMHQIEEGIKEKNVVMDEEKYKRIETELDVLWFISERLGQRLSAYLILTKDMEDTAWKVSLNGCGRGCFVPDSKVLIADGYTKNIQDIQIGDKVISHTGSLRQVYNVLEYSANEKMYLLKILGGREVRCTDNHRILALQRGSCNYPANKMPKCSKFCARFNKCSYDTTQIPLYPTWVEAQNLKQGDLIAIPKYKFQDNIKTNSLKFSDFLPIFSVYDKEQDIINYKDQTSIHTGGNDVALIKDTLIISPEFCELVGNWIGNGWTHENSVGCAFNSGHQQKINRYCSNVRKVFGIEPSLIYHRTRHSVQIFIYNKAIKCMVKELIGHKAENKHIPSFIFESKERMINCLRGLSDTDGSISFKEYRFKYSTISPILHQQVNWVFEALNIYANEKVDDSKTRNHPKWHPELVNDVSSFMFSKFINLVFPEKISELQDKNFKNTSRVKEDDVYYYAPLVDVSTFDYTGKVYDLSVEADTSYNINGVAVHNSACGEYVNYLIGITQVNPLDYGLNWWRFLNKERLELPDIDGDYQPEKKEEIVKLLREKYGEDNVLNCATFRTESLKSAILTIGRGLGYNNDDMQALAALVPSHRGQTYNLKECLEGDEEKGYEPVPNFADKLNVYPGLLDGVRKIEGISTNASIHASALYVFNDGYLSQNSLMRAPNGTKITALNMHDSDDCGALKMDVLFTDAMSKMAKCLDLLLKDGQIEWQGSLKATYNRYLHPDVIDTKNPEMWEQMAEGKISDLFQFMTPVGGTCIKKAKPTTVRQLAEINSIMRLQADSGEQPIDRYVRFRNNIDEWYKEMDEAGLTKGEQEILKKYLAPSFGVSGSQEVLMEILMDPNICNFTLGEANLARKAIAKKQAKKIIQLKKDFYEKGEKTVNAED